MTRFPQNFKHWLPFSTWHARWFVTLDNLRSSPWKVFGKGQALSKNTWQVIGLSITVYHCLFLPDSWICDITRSCENPTALRHFLPFSHRSVTDFRHWCLVIKLGSHVPVHPRGVGLDWGHDSVHRSHILPHDYHFLMDPGLSWKAISQNLDPLVIQQLHKNCQF